MRRLALIAATGLLVSGCMLRISTDPFTNTTSQHRTQVEPDTFSFGSTIVSTFQSGRFFDGGASDIGWATSTDGGSHWTEGFLPGITKYRGAGPYDRASDPSVAYDARHGVWLISSLTLVDSVNPPAGRAVVVSRSTDGLTWGNTPATVATGTFLDKNWTVCDNAPGSASYGHCYTEYDDVTAGDRLHMATSTDGGLTWAQATVPAVSGLGGQPLVQPNGTVIVPYLTTGGAIAALRSSNGGASYTGPVTVASVAQHTVAGNLRSESLPTAEIDAAGRVYVAWADCRYRTGCAANDIVMSTSLNGTSWSPVTRVPIDSTTSTVDHFIPGPRRRQGHVRQLRAPRPDVLLLPERELHELQLSTRRGLRQLDQRGDELELGAAARGPDVAQLAREHQPGRDGRRLHLHVVLGRKGVPGGRRRERTEQRHLRRGHVHVRRWACRLRRYDLRRRWSRRDCVGPRRPGHDGSLCVLTPRVAHHRRRPHQRRLRTIGRGPPTTRS